eukprot:COSAG02_NODE_6811_length_3348_cov_123.512158_2_plen_52_part_00
MVSAKNFLRQRGHLQLLGYHHERLEALRDKGHRAPIQIRSFSWTQAHLRSN